MKKQIGFTLLELLVTLSISAIALSVAIPSFVSLMDRKSIQSVSPLFERSIKYARSEAIQRGQNVQVLPLITGNDWAKGWTVESVSNDGLSFDTLRNFEALPGSPVFTSDDFDTTTPLVIRPSGEAEVTGNFNLNYPHCTGDEKINYQVLISGLLKKSLTACP